MMSMKKIELYEMSSFSFSSPNCNLVRKRSTVESGNPDFEYENDYDQYERIADAIGAYDGNDYDKENIPAVMTCAGQHLIHPSINFI